MTAKDVIELLCYVAEKMGAAKDELSGLDRDIGDGDHGLTMDIGWQAIKRAIGELDGPTLHEVFQTAGRTFLRAVGATVGPLYGGMFLAVAKVSQGKTCLTKDDVGVVFRTAVESLQKRGQAEIGDKTMMDVWLPALWAFENFKGEAMEAGFAALTAGQKGLEHTKELEARKGRASRLGGRSVGHVDPGAQSAYILLEAVVMWIAREKEGVAVEHH